MNNEELEEASGGGDKEDFFKNGECPESSSMVEWRSFSERLR